MTLPGFPSRIVLWHWSVTPGIADSRTFTFLDAEGGDYDPGVVTAKAKDGTVSATVTGTGNTRIVTWSAEQTAALPPTHWRLNFDGEDQVGGRIEISQPEPTPDLSNDWTIQLPGDAEGDGLTITVAGGGGGPAPVPVLESADWWHRHGPHSTVFVDRGPKREHGVYDVAPPPIPDGTYLLAPIIATRSTRPKVSHHSRLTFANGVRIFARGSLGLADGWRPVDGTGHGYADWIFHQSGGTDGIKDAIEIGLYVDDGDRTGFLDSTPAGSEDLEADQFQDYTDPLTAAQYFGVKDWLVEIDFPGGTERRHRWYLPDPEGSKHTPGEAVEHWTLFDTVTRTAPPGFYIDPALDWVLGEEAQMSAFLRLYDLGTGDLALDFQATEATTDGWTDQAGNNWTVGAPIQIVTAADGIVLPAVTIPATAADPGAGSWSVAFRGHLNPNRYLDGSSHWLGTTTNITGAAGWAFVLAPPEYGGSLFGVCDGTDYVATQLGVTDCEKHTVVATVDRDRDLMYVAVDGVEMTPADISAIGTVTGDDLKTIFGLVIDDFALYGRALTLAERAAVSAELTN